MNRLAIAFLLIAVGGFSSGPICGQEKPVPGWPAEVRAIRYPSSADGTLQPSLFYNPGGDQPRPLLIALHSWRGDYKQINPAYGLWCIAKGWVLMHPDFRGMNDHPEACGSELVVKDILSAVDFAKKNCKIDESRIYIMGSSGGGYASLLMAGRAPDIWAGVSAWCGIYDLKDWHIELQGRKLPYAELMNKVCGGKPGDSAAVDEQYRVRSASAWLARAKGVPISISTGITDGHNGSVPVSHSLKAFNALAAKADRIPEKTIQSMIRQPSMPPDLLQTIDDPLFRRKPALFRKTSGNARVTIFQGGHEILYDAGLAWLEQQRKGTPVVWDIREVPTVDLTKLDEKSGK